ncbi:MAG TPA: beta-propeller fold lactonase family protein, partial [Candidatus Limnocylindrales bacterium]|nr:beta-propeller fold lactonase family protein [Candidatus Limnocylindrales bacterium]
VDPGTGLLTPAGHAAAEPVPRAFNIDPDGKFLYAGGLESGRLTAFRIDAASGRLDPIETYPVGARPMWVTILRLA